MRHLILIAATLIALTAQPVLVAQPVSAQEQSRVAALDPGDTVEDFLRAIERNNLVRAEALLAASDGGGTMRQYLFGDLRPSGPARIDILSENIDDGDPGRASVEVRITFGEPYGSLQRDYAYRLVMENGRYKIAEEEVMEWPPPASLPNRNHAPGDGSGPGGAVVEYLRAMEQGDIPRVDDVLATAHDGLLRAELFSTFYYIADELNEYGLEFTILAEEVYEEGSTIQARVQVMHDEHAQGRLARLLNEAISRVSAPAPQPVPSPRPSTFASAREVLRSESPKPFTGPLAYARRFMRC